MRLDWESFETLDCVRIRHSQTDYLSTQLYRTRNDHKTRVQKSSPISMLDFSFKSHERWFCWNQMSCPSSPYDTLAVTSFVLGCLTSIAAIYALNSFLVEDATQTEWLFSILIRVIDSHWWQWQRYCDPRPRCRVSYRCMGGFITPSQRSQCSH